MPSILWEPTAVQRRFLSCPLYEVLFGGAAGGGKSAALLIDALGQADKARYRALIIRRSYPELSELIDRSRELYPAAFPGAKYNSTDKRWTFPSGATIAFGYVAQDGDVYRYQGQEYTYVAWDELTHFSEFAYKYLMSRCRTSDPELRCYIRATANPGGPGHGWVKARFIDPAPPMMPIDDEATGTRRVFIPALLVDNPHLARTDYGQRLNALPDADRKALLQGDWDAYTGSVFTLERGVHAWDWRQFEAITGHKRPPAEWTRFRSLDWGYAKPFAVYWYAVDFEGRAYVYREWYGCQKDSRGAVIPDTGVRMEPELVAAKIAAIEAEAGECVLGVADPACWAKGKGDYGGGPSIVEAMAKHGVHWDAGKNDRLQGKLALHEWLRYERDGEGRIAEYPGLIFIAEETPHAQRTIPALEYDEHRVEDVDSTLEDHAYDSVRYFGMMRPWVPKRPDTSPKWLKRSGKSSWI